MEIIDGLALGTLLALAIGGIATVLYVGFISVTNT